MGSPEPKQIPRILDIDLDFFLNNRFIDVPKSCRLDDTDFHPWRADRVRRFLVDQCGLCSQVPVRGAYFQKHDELFWKWKVMIEGGELTTPFEVVHVDAHADLGLGSLFGSLSITYILHEHLHLPLAERTNPPIGDRHLSEGSFLLFAIACRWIKGLTYVYHPDCPDQGRNDVPRAIKTDLDDESGFIQLRCLPSGQDSQSKGFEFCKPLYLEPKVRFERVPGEKLRESEPFDFVFLTRSPQYTPQSADALIPIIREYIDETS